MSRWLSNHSLQFSSSSGLIRFLYDGLPRSGSAFPHVHAAIWHNLFQELGGLYHPDPRRIWNALFGALCPFAGRPAAVYSACLHDFGHGVIMISFAGSAAVSVRTIIIIGICPQHQSKGVWPRVTHQVSLLSRTFYGRFDNVGLAWRW